MNLSRVPYLLWAVVAAVAGVVLLLGAGGRAVASPNDGVDFSQVIVAADTGAGMEEELGALGAAWNEGAQSGGSFAGFGFTDTVRPPFLTADPATFQSWVQDLKVAPDGTCPENALRALMAAARIAAPEEPGQARALLLSDSAPWGNRRALATTVNRLLQSDIQLYQVITGWCAGARLTPRELSFLSQATGGLALQLPLTSTRAPENRKPSSISLLTDTFRLNLRQMRATDSIFWRQGWASTETPDQLAFPVDGLLDSITILGVEDDPNANCPPWCCLTCVHPVSVYAPLTFTLRTPDATIITPGSPGVESIQLLGMTQFQIPVDKPSLQGLWQIRVQGEGSYRVYVDGESPLHLDYLGQHSVTAGKFYTLTAALSPGGDTGVTFEQLQFGLLDGGGRWLGDLEMAPAARDTERATSHLLFSAGVTLPRGIYYLAVRGQLSDGTPFARLDPAPIRVLPFRLQAPPATTGTPGSSLEQTFQLSNDGNTTQLFELDVSSSQGWAITDTVPTTVTLMPGASTTVRVPLTIPDSALAGTQEETLLTAVSDEGLFASATVEAQTTVTEGGYVLLPYLKR